MYLRVVKPYPVEKEVNETKLITKIMIVAVVRVKRRLLRRRFLFEREKVEAVFSFNILGRMRIKKATPPKDTTTYSMRR